MTKKITRFETLREAGEFLEKEPGWEFPPGSALSPTPSADVPEVSEVWITLDNEEPESEGWTGYGPIERDAWLAANEEFIEWGDPITSAHG